MDPWVNMYTHTHTHVSQIQQEPSRCWGHWPQISAMALLQHPELCRRHLVWICCTDWYWLVIWLQEEALRELPPLMGSSNITKTVGRHLQLAAICHGCFCPDVKPVVVSWARHQCHSDVCTVLWAHNLSNNKQSEITSKYQRPDGIYKLYNNNRGLTVSCSLCCLVLGEMERCCLAAVMLCLINRATVTPG